MKPIFVTLGLLLFAYTVVALVNGAVYARSGIGGRIFTRAAQPRHYWSAVIVYAWLAVALVFWF